ncbi:MAG: PQQ-binding-like beta-propeller repeat protein [Verrucomicrobiota bacterium]|jgi:outer membrane protein assembly factor BamB|nr:PQQ-binding-like beta-propeller repeat protein [Verrucomicrobiota bacterium]
MKKPLPFILSCLLSGSTFAAGNWPHWRGPGYDGVSLEKGLPIEWSEDKNIAWKLPLSGGGSATPVVWGGKIFLLAQAEQQISLLCVSTAGKLLWTSKVAQGRGRASGEKTLASPSPSTDGTRVYTMTGTGEVVAFDLTGAEVWRFNAQERYGRFRLGFGYHTTPVLHDGQLYLQLIHSGGAWVVAIDVKSGRETWKVERPSDGVAECEHAYTSPCIWNDGANAQLITHGNDYAIGHRLSDGKELWRVAELNPKERYNRTLRFVSSPVASTDLLVIPSAKGRGVVGLKPGAVGIIMPGNKNEQWRLTRGTPDVVSPLIYGSEVYLNRENGSILCLDAKTGKEHYSERAHAQTYRGSPVAADGKIYLTARDGTVSVIKAGPKFEVLYKNKISDQLTASPVPSNGRIYLRGFKSLYAIGKK